MSNLKILFVGSNPAVASSTDEAFAADTASGRILRGWTEGIDGVLLYENIVSQKTENNRPLKRYEMDEGMASLLERINGINPDRIVALGKNATYVLEKLKLEFLEMPHPSGLNRKLNDTTYANRKICELRQYCEVREI